MTTETTQGDTPTTQPAATDAKARANSIVQITRQHDGTILAKVKGFDPIHFNPGKASLLNRKHAEFHGWKQRLSDKAAVSADTNTGKTDAQVKYDGIKRLVEFYELGGDEWAMKSAAGGKVAANVPDVGLLIRAMIGLGKATDLDHANGRIDGLAAKRGVDRTAAIALLWAAGDIAIEVNRLKLEARTFAMNSDDLLEDEE